MPDEDVIMTAIWKPVNYVIIFETRVKSIPEITIRGETGTIIIAPSLDAKREGYIFVGWKIYDTEIYYPGDEIYVKGKMPGAGIGASAIWKLK